LRGARGEGVLIKGEMERNPNSLMEFCTQKTHVGLCCRGLACLSKWTGKEADIISFSPSIPLTHSLICQFLGA